MTFSKSFYLAGLTAALAVLAGCGGSTQTQPLVAEPASSVLFNRSMSAARPDPEKSWMLPGIQNNQNLLYIANSASGSVTIYTYYNGNGLLLIGKLTGFSGPGGICTDRSGNIWIPAYGNRHAGQIYEYQHGGTVPIETIRLHDRPEACAVDPTTGNLAVVVSKHPKYYPRVGYVIVYPKGSKNGQVYSTYPGFADVYFATYDNVGNLYVDGRSCIPSPYYCNGGPTTLYKLSKNGSEFMPLTLRGAKLVEPIAINWLKPTLLVGDRDFKNQGTSGAYKVLVSGSTATVVGTLQFNGTQQTFGFWRRAGRVVVPDSLGNIVRIYNLSDGTLHSQLTADLASPVSAAVSQ